MPPASGSSSEPRGRGRRRSEIPPRIPRPASRSCRGAKAPPPARREDRPGRASACARRPRGSGARNGTRSRPPRPPRPSRRSRRPAGPPCIPARPRPWGGPLRPEDPQLGRDVVPGTIPPEEQHMGAMRLARRVFVSFIVTFALARSMALLMLVGRMHDFFLRFGQTHVHHLNYGIFILSGVGAYLIFVRPDARW